MKTIKKFTDAQELEEGVKDKINEIIDVLNEVTSRLFPSLQPKKENTGYVNEEITDHKIGDPNDS